MVLSKWHSHCESSPGSRDKCRTTQVAADLQTDPTGLSHKLAYKQLGNCIHHRRLLLLIFVLLSHGGQRAESTQVAGYIPRRYTCPQSPVQVVTATQNRPNFVDPNPSRYHQTVLVIRAHGGRNKSLMPNTHRRRRRDETVLSRRVDVGGVYMNSQLAHDDCRRIRSTIQKLAKQTVSVSVSVSV